MTQCRITLRNVLIQITNTQMENQVDWKALSSMYITSLPLLVGLCKATWPVFSNSPDLSETVTLCIEKCSNESQRMITEHVATETQPPSPLPVVRETLDLNPPINHLHNTVVSVTYRERSQNQTLVLLLLIQ